MTSNAIQISRATLEQSDLLAKLGAETFQESFRAANRAEDMAAHLHRTYAPAIVAEHLADPKCTYFIAHKNELPAGFAKLRTHYRPDCISEKNIVELHQIYVLRAFHGQKVGAALMRACLDAATRKGYDFLWLGVWENNIRAREFYQKWGFEEVGSHAFVLGADFQTDLILKLSLK